MLTLSLDLKPFEPIQKKANEIKQYTVEWGVFDTATYEDGQTVATIANILEFGTEFIPARSFTRLTFLTGENDSNLLDLYAKASQAIIFQDQDITSALSDVGEGGAKLYLAKFDQAKSWADPLDSSTVREKGSNTPLVKTEKLRKNLGWQVLKGATVMAEGKAA